MSLPFRVAPFVSRRQLGAYLNAAGLLGVGAEIGTYRGDFACVLRADWAGEELICIDPWSDVPGYEEQFQLLWGSKDHEENHQRALEVLSHQHGRSRCLRATSREAASQFADGSLDFVYIDGDHRYEATLEDLQLWWPRVRAGGVVAGHDILCPPDYKTHEDWGLGVRTAVEEFAAAGGLEVFLIPEPELWQPWSYLLRKP